ncbi:YdeI/OmpD-associated family protein [Pseudarthrobacter sp. MEB009]|uniref:YdeI/OmpD-associated family protein n=1 Tax=Pseudarthrobacter sp. MEB009 TaxID=3040326 RepID=UPI0025579DBD|nr:YdeI/OmpD-associated family protein [Pseudarthrobacter sp. MEB009]
MKFTTVIAGSGNKTGIEVPASIVDALAAGKRPPVVVTLNGASYRSSIAVMGGHYLIGLSAANRELTGAGAGDAVEVDVVVDTEPRVVEVPADLAAALAADSTASDAYAALNYSAQRRLVEPLALAKTEETRARRVAKAVSDLNPGQQHG